MVKRTHINTQYTINKNWSEYWQAIVTYAVEAYSYLLDVNRQFTYAEFAQVISYYYDINNPQTAEVVRVLALVDAV